MGVSLLCPHEQSEPWARTRPKNYLFYTICKKHSNVPHNNHNKHLYNVKKND
ncbi:MAG: hypothetical protein NZ455_00905 [Bacteroidia bacterium]|nr:hypothetical protein [Bacteroidia bacterium]